ncbi:MAG TPA: MlaE family lipid ABC transporter permease subunit [Xanthobacteraceae bacterium]|nr:MlaE family lipid ABC transporter permease subunit [Xanthobacteraceae bacterium]
MNGGPLLESADHGGRLALSAGGAWTAERASELERLIERVIARHPRVDGVDIDMGGVERLDTFGAWLLERLMRALAAAGGEARVVSLPDRYRGLVLQAQELNRAAPAPARGHALGAAIAALGRNVGEVGADLVAAVAMIGALAAALGRAALRPRSFRFTSLVHQIDRVGWRAVPIVLLITFLIGGILAQQGLFHFREFGAEIYVVDMIGILVLREVGVLMVAIMVAGRSGSSYTAELGSMKMREEIDALRTMGFDPIDVLVLPRVLALVIAVPCLAFLGSMAALYGGGLMCWLYGGMSPEVFLARLRQAIDLQDFAIGLIKAPFMGLIIGVIAGTQGLAVKGSAESLGLKTTDSVVKSIFLVILLDGFLAVFFAAIGL